MNASGFSPICTSPPFLINNQSLRDRNGKERGVQPDFPPSLFICVQIGPSLLRHWPSTLVVTLGLGRASHCPQATISRTWIANREYREPIQEIRTLCLKKSVFKTYMKRSLWSLVVWVVFSHSTIFANFHHPSPTIPTPPRTSGRTNMAEWREDRSSGKTTPTLHVGFVWVLVWAPSSENSATLSTNPACDTFTLFLRLPLLSRVWNLIVRSSHNKGSDFLPMHVIVR